MLYPLKNIIQSGMAVLGLGEILKVAAQNILFEQNEVRILKKRCEWLHLLEQNVFQNHRLLHTMS